MSMTRKDFIELAYNIKEILKEIKTLKLNDETNEQIKRRILDNIISFCRGQNENFDDYKFKSMVLN